MGTCLSKKKESSTTSPVSGSKSVSVCSVPAQSLAELKNSGIGVTFSKPKEETESEQLKQKKEKTETLQEKKQEPSQEDGGGQVRKEIFIIKHRKSHDDRERNSKSPEISSASTNETGDSMGHKIVVPATPNMGVGVGVRTSSCTKEEVESILIQCGRLSRSSSGKAATSSAAAIASGERGGRTRYSGSKRSYDFDHCDNNDAISAEDGQKKTNATTENSDLCCEDDDAEKRHQHRQRHRQSPSPRPSSQGRRRRTPSRERDQNQRSSSRERRISRSPGRRSSETNTANGSNISSNNNSYSKPGKLVSVPATVSSLVMDKSNNGGVGCGESAASTGIKRITVKRNVGAASPRSQSPARANGNAANSARVLSDNQQQQQPSLSRNNSSRKAEQSPCRRNPLSEIDPNSLAFPQPTTTNNSNSRVQNRPKKEIEAEANEKPNVDTNDNCKNRTNNRVALEKGVSTNCKTKEQQEQEIKVQPSVTDNIVVKTMVPSGVENNLKPQTLTRSRSSIRSRDLEINPEALLNPAHQSYTSLLLEDIQNFHQKNTNTPSSSLPACLTKACSILEAVADLNSTTSSNFSGGAFSEDKRSPPTYQSSIRNEHNVPPGKNTHYGRRVPDITDPFVESEVIVSDDVMEPSLHKYVTVKRGGSLGGGVVDMDDQESSGSNSFIVSGQQQPWEPNSADSTDSWTSRLNSRDEGQNQRSPLLGLEGIEVAEERKGLNSRRNECDHQHSSGIGRGRLGANRSLHTVPVVTATAST